LEQKPSIEVDDHDQTVSHKYLNRWRLSITTRRNDVDIVSNSRQLITELIFSHEKTTSVMSWTGVEKTTSMMSWTGVEKTTSVTSWTGVEKTTSVMSWTGVVNDESESVEHVCQMEIVDDKTNV